MRVLMVGLLAACVAGTACSGGAPAPETGGSVTDSETAATSGTGATRSTAVRQTALREVTLPAGTELPIVLDTPVGSDTSRAEEPVQAHVARTVTVGGQPVVPEGSSVAGVVTDSTRSGRVKGRAHIAVRFDTLTLRGDEERYRIETSAIGRTARGTKKKDALEIGGGAAGGALIGALIGGKKGALIGTAAGGGAGTAIVLSTRGQEIHLAKGAALRLRLNQPVTVKIRA